MIDMIESIMKGDKLYPEALKAAKIYWDEFFVNHANDDGEKLKEAVTSAQLPYQWAVEKVGLTAPFAKSIMVLTCIASLYHDGFKDPELAKRTIKAFANSKTMSMGISSSAKEVALLYGLDKD